jgi:hypothetical protein
MILNVPKKQTKKAKFTLLYDGLKPTHILKPVAENYYHVHGIIFIFPVPTILGWSDIHSLIVVETVCLNVLSSEF